MQNLIFTLPNTGAILGFACRGLEDLPGIGSVRYTTAGDAASSVSNGSEEAVFRVHIGDTEYATLSCTVTDPGAFRAYRGYVHNICFMIAARLHEQRHQQLVAEYQHRLEHEVEERTADLLAARQRADAERNRAEMYLETAEAIIVELDRSARIERINARGARLLGYRPESLLAADWFEIASPPEHRSELRQDFLSAMEGDTPIVEYGDREIVTRDGERRFLHWHVVPRYDTDGTLIGTIGSGQDVTERLRAERQKEILLKEVYHRTKNNMQVICSLLTLQAGTAAEEAVRRSLNDAKNRIMSMALVHTMLYSTDDIAHLSLKPYIEQLAAQLLSGYSGFGKRIALEMTGRDFNVNLETAVPCGLVLNEVITNSVKHAFDGVAAHPVVSIDVDRIDDTIVIECRDNGKGFTGEPKDVPGAGIGVQILHHVITEQLGGEVDINGDGGTRVTIRLPADVVAD